MLIWGKMHRCPVTVKLHTMFQHQPDAILNLKSYLRFRFYTRTVEVSLFLPCKYQLFYALDSMQLENLGQCMQLFQNSLTKWEFNWHLEAASFPSCLLLRMSDVCQDEGVPLRKIWSACFSFFLQTGEQTLKKRTNVDNKSKDLYSKNKLCFCGFSFFISVDRIFQNNHVYCLPPKKIRGTLCWYRRMQQSKMRSHYLWSHHVVIMSQSSPRNHTLQL